MRKLLLIAAVMFSLGSMAQSPLRLAKEFKMAENNLKKVNNLMRVSLPSASTMKKAPAKAAPEGESRTYYLDFYTSAYGVGTLPEFHKAVNVVYGADNKVYIQNMMYPSLFDTYIEGELNGNTITIPNGQAIGTYGDTYNMVLCNMAVVEETDGVSFVPDQSSEFTLTVDNEYGTITSGENSFLGIVTDDYRNTLTVGGIMQFVPEDLFPAADEHEYTYDHEGYDTPIQTVNGTLEVISLGDYSYIKGLMPELNPDAWSFAYMENGNLTLSLPQIIDEDMAAVFADLNNGQIMTDPIAFTYDAASDCYTMSDYTLVNLFATSSNSLGYSDSYDNLKIKATTTGINKVESSDADVVSTQYFDISGRRINSAQKGINVKVMKYSDGTTKTVKVIK
jgi:hypothetical protein